MGARSSKIVAHLIYKNTQECTSATDIINAIQAPSVSTVLIPGQDASWDTQVPRAGCEPLACPSLMLIVLAIVDRLNETYVR